MLHDVGYRLNILTSQFYDDSEKLLDERPVLEALIIGAHIWLNGALRDAPPRYSLFDILLARLQNSLDQPGLVDLWIRFGGLKALVWVLTVADCVCEVRPKCSISFER